MIHYGISKNNDKYNDSWTSISDVGKEISGTVLTLDEYERVESYYIKYILSFYSLKGVGQFKIKSIEDDRRDGFYEGRYTGLENYKVEFEKNEFLSSKELELVSRLCLREMLWVRLETESGCYITFGHDLNLRIGFPKEIEPSNGFIRVDGLFITKYDFDPSE